MKLYHAGGWRGEGGLLRVIEREPVENVLVSFAYVRDIAKTRAYFDALRAAGVRSIFLDSGAFTAHQQGTTIDLAELERAIEALQPDVYVQLDVIGDPAATRRNLERMRADGFRPVPVFTRGASLDDLAVLHDEGERYVCLGGIAKTRSEHKSAWWLRTTAWLRHVFAGATPDRLPRYHAFGITDQQLLEAFPFYSADSSAAVMQAAFGTVLEHVGGCTRTRNVNTDRAAAFDHAQASDRAGGGYVQRRVANVRALNRMAAHVTKVWQARGVTWECVA